MGRPLPAVQKTYTSVPFNIIKVSVVLLSVLNILSSIWVGIYLTAKVNQIKWEADNNRLDPFGGIDEYSKKMAEVWKGIIIAVLVVTDIISVLGIFGAVTNNYFVSMVYCILMFSYAVFAAAVDYIRGSVSSWLVPFITANMVSVFVHKIRVEIIQPTVYSQPAESA